MEIQVYAVQQDLFTSARERINTYSGTNKQRQNTVVIIS